MTAAAPRAPATRQGALYDFGTRSRAECCRPRLAACIHAVLLHALRGFAARLASTHRPVQAGKAGSAVNAVLRRWREAGLDRMRTSPKTCSVYAHSSLVGTAAAEARLLTHLHRAACSVCRGLPGCRLHEHQESHFVP